MTACSRIVLDTPIGCSLEIVSDGSAIAASQFVACTRKPVARPRDALLRECSLQVDAYFRRRLRRFDLPYRFEGTELQCAIWQLVSTLETGEIASYGDVARAIGRPLAHRAVAMAMSRLRLDLFVPAHRIIGSDGRLKGASPGSRRRKLLEFEGYRIRRDGTVEAVSQSRRPQ